MTLTQDLRYPSPVSTYLDRYLVSLEPHQAAWLEQCLDHPEIGSLSDDYNREAASRYGLAMEWAIGFDLAQDVPYQAELDAFRADGGDRAAALVQAGGFACAAETERACIPWSEWKRSHRPSALSDHDAAPLLAGCWNVVGEIELLHRVSYSEPGGVLTKPNFWRDWYEPVPEAPWLTDLWDAYRQLGRPQLEVLGQPVDIAVKLVDRYAVADLVLGSAVIDIKYTLEPEPKLEEWLRQVIAYALLVQDRLIDRVGIYLVRQARLITWELDTLLPGVNLDNARQEFARIVSERAPD